MSQDVERVYTINLGKVLLSQSQHRAVRALNMIREFARRHTKVEDIKIDEELAQQIWNRGVRRPPRKIRVIMDRTDEGHILVSPYNEQIETMLKSKKEESDTKEDVKSDESDKDFVFVYDKDKSLTKDDASKEIVSADEVVKDAELKESTDESLVKDDTNKELESTDELVKDAESKDSTDDPVIKDDTNKESAESSNESVIKDEPSKELESTDESLVKDDTNKESAESSNESVKDTESKDSESKNHSN